MIRPRLIAALALLLTPVASIRAQRGTLVPILIRNVSVIDGTGAAPRAGMDVVLADGKIAQVVPSGRATGAVPDSVIDGRGGFVIPGLWDAHVHLGTGAWGDRAALLRNALLGGVTSVYDMAGDTRATSDLQRAVITREIAGPSIYYVALIAGPAFFTDPRVLDASRGYAPGAAPWAQSATAGSDWVRIIATARGTGATAIKLYTDMDSTSVTRATAEAKRQGPKVVAHATTFPGLPSDLVAAGADMLAHSPYLVWQGSPRTADFPARGRGNFAGVPVASPSVERLLQSMKERGTALNATLWVFDRQANDDVGRARLAWSNAVTKRAAELGVRIVAGTDGLLGDQRDPLPSIHRELELLVNGAGLRPLGAIAAATRNAAWSAGVESTVGTIAPGMVADLLLLEKDPTVDIRNTRSLRVVLREGRVARMQ